MYTNMKYIAVRTSNAGKSVNSVYPMWFEFHYQADKMCKKLNKTDVKDKEEWIVMTIPQYVETL